MHLEGLLVLCTQTDYGGLTLDPGHCMRSPLLSSAAPSMYTGTAQAGCRSLLRPLLDVTASEAGAFALLFGDDENA